MINIFFEDEEIKEDDLYFICYIIERIARTLDDYNCSAYYEPTPTLVRSYYNSSFN